MVKKAYVVITSSVYYQGISNNFGSDFTIPYLNDWLKFIGVSDIENIRISLTVVNTDYEKTKQL